MFSTRMQIIWRIRTSWSSCISKSRRPKRASNLPRTLSRVSCSASTGLHMCACDTTQPSAIHNFMFMLYASVHLYPQLYSLVDVVCILRIINGIAYHISVISIIIRTYRTSHVKRNTQNTGEIHDLPRASQPFLAVYRGLHSTVGASQRKGLETKALTRRAAIATPTSHGVRCAMFLVPRRTVFC